MTESRQNFKLKPKEKFISTQLLTNIIESSDISKAVVEEPTSELWYETLNGRGKITFKNNVTYEGFLKYGILNNEDPDNPCSIHFPDGTVFIGTIKNNEITGEGTYTFEDGSTYSGQVLNGLREGKGTFKTLDGIVYEGEWKNGLKHGKGRIIQGNMELEGNWNNGILNGKCRIKWKSGNIFNGQLINNSMDGSGYMVWYNKNEKYTGMWKNNLQNGYGIHVWYDSKNENKFFRDRYVGQWKNGKRDGYGKFYYSNGNIYEGQWKENKKEGFGVFSYQDRTKYIGSFKDDNLINSINLKPIDEMNKTKTPTIKDKKSRINKNIDEIKIPISINDLINTEPETKQSLKEIDNLILRNLSLITHLYLYASGKEDIKSMEMGLSSLGGTILNESKNLHKQYSRKNSKISNDTSNNLKQIESQVYQSDKKQEKTIDYDNVYNNDLYFCLDFIHFWKLLRECGLITAEFSLAMIDRICFHNPDNIIEMFYIPEILIKKNNIEEEKEIIYEYLYKKIEKSKYDFENKYKVQIEKSKILINAENTRVENEKNDKKTQSQKIDKNSNKTPDKKSKINASKEIKGLIKVAKVAKKEEKNEEKSEENKKEYENYLDYHDGKNIILLRYFYEIIIRLAYIRYNENPDIPIVTRVKTLLDELKKFLRTKIKSGNADSPITASILMIDPKLKNIDIHLDKFICEHYVCLEKIFKEIYEYSCDNENTYKPFDMTITYRFFYDNIILNSEALSKVFKSKMEYIDIISIYIKDKKINSYNYNSVSNMYKSSEIMEYLDNLLDYEMIFREFCELIFFISRKYFIFYQIKNEEEETINNNKSISMSRRTDEFKKKQKSKKISSSRKIAKVESKDEKDNGENKEIKEINNIDNYKIVINYVIQEIDKLKQQDKYKDINYYSYPLLKTHQAIINLIEDEKKRKIEEERREKEKQRYTKERNLLKDEDLNIYKEEDEGENTSESFDEEL